MHRLERLNRQFPAYVVAIVREAEGETGEGCRRTSLFLMAPHRQHTRDPDRIRTYFNVGQRYDDQPSLAFVAEF